MMNIKYTIQKYDGINITFKYDNEQIIDINLLKDYSNYEFSTHYFIDDENNIIKINELKNKNQHYVFKNKKLYTKCPQYQLDKYLTKYPISSNGQLYKHLQQLYYTIFIN